MQVPIAGIPIFLELKQGYWDSSGAPSQELPEHWAGALRSVWRRIPRADRDVMVADIGRYNNRRLTVRFVTEWAREWGTNAFIKARTDGVIAIDAGYAGAADSAHLGATLAHELAHYRDFAGDNDSELTEARARQIAEGTWGFPRGQVLYKSEECRQVEAVLNERGITGGVFWDAGMDSFVYVRDGRRIRLSVIHHLLHETVEGSLVDLLEGDAVLSFRSQADRDRHREFRRKLREGARPDDEGRGGHLTSPPEPTSATS